MTTTQITQRIQGIYDETADFYNRVVRNVPALCYGYKILYGPPYFRPPILFIGYQPGWSTKTVAADALWERKQWYERFEFAARDYRIAKQVQQLVHQPTLEKCVALNSIFVRARSRTFYHQALRTRPDVDWHAAIWDFCRTRVMEIVELLEPQLIIVIGFESGLLWAGPLMNHCTNSKGRVLTRETEITGRPALNTLHLSGCRIAREDMGRIRDRIHSHCADTRIR